MTKRLTAPLAGLLPIGLFRHGGLPTSLGNNSLDLLFRLRGPLPSDQRIVIIGVDEPSLRQLGGWPFPPRLHAELLGHLRQARGAGHIETILTGDGFAHRVDLSEDPSLPAFSQVLLGAFNEPVALPCE